MPFDARRLVHAAHLLSALLLFVMNTGGAVAAQQSVPSSLQPLVQELDGAATNAMKDPKSASLTLGIVTKDGLVWSKSYGFADIEKKTLATPDSVYRLGSITKQFTALMLLQLVHDGKVHLTDPVEKYFPEINLVQGRYSNAPPITLLQLATHTAGLDREPDDLDTYLKGSLSDWEKVLIAALPHTKYISEPGTEFSYSNIGYAILGAALGRAAHQPFTEYVKQHILLPLGMTHSDFEATPSIRKTLTTGYTPDDKGKLDSAQPTLEHAGRGYKVPNGALYSTVGDLARFEVFEMMNGPETVLPRKELEKNYNRIIFTNTDLDNGYGIGFLIQQSVQRADVTATFIGHSGAVAGYAAWALFEPHANVGIVILDNANDGKGFKLMDIFVHKLEVKPPAKNAK
jgi:CubicO group peptidase (beta-lactamase class C family)